MTEYEIEPIRGLPGMLPPGEHILWQGSPDRALLARSAFHTRAVAAYFALLAAIAIGVTLTGGNGGGWFGLAATAGCGVAACAILHALAWVGARTSVYTLTNRRIVLRIGVAIPKCINLPLSQIVGVDLAARGDGSGDIALRMSETKFGWVVLWPHARPWRLARAEPMLRSIPDAQAIAAMIGRACLAAVPQASFTAPAATAASTPSFAEPLAA